MSRWSCSPARSAASSSSPGSGGPREKCSYLRDGLRKVCDRAFLGPVGAEEQEHAPVDALPGCSLECERVRRALQAVAGDLGVEVGVVTPGVRLVVDDDESVVVPVDEVDVAL